jgi:hypothetical protein
MLLCLTCARQGGVVVVGLVANSQPLMVARAKRFLRVYNSSCSLCCLVSKENDLDSNASSIDTDMEDNLSQDNQSYNHLVSATPTANSVLIASRTLDDELNDVSLNENDQYLTSSLSDMHLLHPSVNTDPNLNHHNRTIVDNTHLSSDLNTYQHGHVLQYYANAANERPKLVKSESIPTPSASAHSAGDASYDPNSDMTFLYDLVTPPANNANRRLLPSQTNHHITNLFEDGWNG